jgi:fumarate hydratase class II
MTDMRKEADSLGEVMVPADRLWGAQTQRSLEHFSIGKDLIPAEGRRQREPCRWPVGR